MNRIALKRLTASDLTFFRWHFENQPAGNQKAINLNADVFIDRLYPGLPDLANQHFGRLPLDLSLFGPGSAPEYNVQRKIIKHESYKNWRLDGEFIMNPPESPERFNSLQPEDLVILEFQGEASPVACRAVLLAQSDAADSAVHGQLSGLLGNRSMIELTAEVLDQSIGGLEIAEDHPIRYLASAEPMEDAALGGEEGKTALQKAGAHVAPETLERSRRSAITVGELGEELVDIHLASEKASGVIDEYEWVSRTNAVSPYDFTTAQGDEPTAVEVKSTGGDFTRPIHVSFGELKAMRDSSKYHLYRVYGLVEGDGATLRVATNTQDIASEILDVIASLPYGTTLDSVSLDPGVFEFGPEIELTYNQSSAVELSS